MYKTHIILAILIFSISFSLSSQQKVGVNKTNPNQSLDVNGNVNIDGNIMLNGQEGQPDKYSKQMIQEAPNG